MRKQRIEGESHRPLRADGPCEVVAEAEAAAREYDIPAHPWPRRFRRSSSFYHINKNMRSDSLGAVPAI